MSSRQISVVVPVYDEHENIAECLRRLARGLDGHEHEILICYDRDEDTTLPAIAAMPDRSSAVRLVRNDIGRGAANAIRAGFEAARGDVIVTSMADLSDPPEVIPKMAELMRRDGLAVVAGSRYMRGGSQTGGPFLKRTLSRVAGVALDLVAGIGTKDATSNFRAYSAEFLRATNIESRGGFEIALELTTKAHLSGRLVGEVASSWIDRSAGTSRFRLWKWLPSYLGWWIRAAWQPALVLAVWLALALSACLTVARSSHVGSLPEDVQLASMLANGDMPVFRGLADLGTPRGELLPALVHRGLWSMTHDLRAAQYTVVVLLSAAAWGLVLVARRARGRTLVVDAVFPLLMLDAAHSGTFHSASTLGAALVAGVVVCWYAIAATCVGTWSLARAFTVSAALVALLVSGAVGVAFLPVALGASGLFALHALRDRASRASAAIVLGATTIVSLCVLARGGAATGVGSAIHSTDLDRMLFASRHVVGAAFGPATQPWWPEVGSVVLAFTAITLLALVVRAVQRVDERSRSIALGACVLAAGWVAMRFAVEDARGDVVHLSASSTGILLASSFIAAVHLAWAPSRSRLARTLIPSLLGLGAVLAFVLGRG